MCWKNLTLKVRKLILSEEKVILKEISGYVRMGSLWGLMGPSGAGKSSLLRALYGHKRDLITKDSEIYFNKNIKMKTCFISQDVRLHIIDGLTVKESLFYATKLKNSSSIGKSIDYNSIVDKLMNDFAIVDIKDVKIGKCSSGQQKKCVLAMELCTEELPNIMFVDEPTSGLDSYSAEMVRSLIY